MSVYRPKRADGTRQAEYIYDFRWRGHRFCEATGETEKRRAEAVEDAVRKRLKSEAIDRRKPLNFGAASTLYWSEVGQFHRNATDTERALEWLQREIGLTARLNRITNAVVADLVARRRADGVANKTVNIQVIEPLRGILRRAAEVWDQEVARIDWKRHALPVRREHVREATADEEAAIAAAAPADYRPLIAFAFMNGCRLAEMVGLTWADVDFFNREFSVTGKGDRTRTIPMTRPSYDLLWSLKDHHKTAVFTYTAKKTRAMADGLRVRGRRYPVTYEGVKTAWRRTIEASGVEAFRFHDMRHTAASRVARTTRDLRIVRDLLGHEDISTTMRYAHLTRKDLRDGLEATHSAAKAESAERSAMKSAMDAPVDSGKSLIQRRKRD